MINQGFMFILLNVSCPLVGIRPHQVRLARIMVNLSPRWAKFVSKAHLMRTDPDKRTTHVGICTSLLKQHKALDVAKPEVCSETLSPF
jgi:hypothetical protein